MNVSVPLPLFEFGNYINRYKVSNFLRNDQIFLQKKEEINKLSLNFLILMFFSCEKQKDA